MSNHRNKERQLVEQYCRENGYVSCGVNWYRCYGEGLLQVVSFEGLRRSTEKQCAGIGLYSLYSRIMWLNFTYMGVRRDVIPNISPANLICTQENPPQTDGINDLELMWNYGFFLLDMIDTHEKLAHLRESLDIVRGQKVIMNDSNKLVPYLLSGQSEKALTLIDAIEQQNRQAYKWNCISMPNADHEQERKKMEDNLKPLLVLKECICSSKWHDVVEWLQANYQNNIAYLSGKGIPGPVEQINQDKLLWLLSNYG